MQDIEVLINEYCEVTGRPAAIISVSEYLELKKFCSSQQITSDITTKETQIETSTICDDSSNVVSTSKDDFYNDGFMMHEVQEEPEIEEMEEKGNNTVSSAFLMMRSIGS